MSSENSGFIALHRKILDNPIVCRDNDYFRVWLHLLLNATHTTVPHHTQEPSKRSKPKMKSFKDE